MGGAIDYAHGTQDGSQSFLCRSPGRAGRRRQEILAWQEPAWKTRSRRRDQADDLYAQIPSVR